MKSNTSCLLARLQLTPDYLKNTAVAEIVGLQAASFVVKKGKSE